MRPDTILMALATRMRHLGFAQCLWPVGLALTLSAQGCIHDILSVTDPDIVTEETLRANTAVGAMALHNGTIFRLAQATAGPGTGADPLFLFGGLMTDEWLSGDTFIQRNTEDQRIFDDRNTFNAPPFRAINRVRVQAGATIDALRQYQPSPATNIARMFAFIAYVEVLAGEHYCNGVPLSSFVGSAITYGDPLSNDSLFALATANADSAISNLGGVDSARVQWLAQVVKGRALLDRGQFAAASTAVAGVPDTFHYDVTYSVVAGDNQLWALNASARRYTVGNGDGGGLNFIGARKDPRIRTKTGPDRIFDTAFNLQVTRQGTWDRTTAVKVATGVEARLIEAEAALRASTPDYITWLARLNQLRRNTQLYPPAPADTSYKPVAGTVLADTTDPGTDPARVDLTFRERAFWMFGTGHRLGDMRRLLRQYGRTENTVYPHGAWFKGGNFGDAIQMPIPFDEQNNPKFVRCADRLP